MHLHGIAQSGWIVKRVFAWLNHARRLSKNYEITAPSAETFVKIIRIRRMVRLLK